VNEKLESLYFLPSSAKWGILFGSVAVIVGGFYFLSLSPKYDELGQREEKIKKTRMMIAEKEGIARNIGAFRKEVDRLNEELTKALKELPDKKEIPQLLAKVSDKARDTGLEIRLFKPQAEVKRDFYSEVPVEVEVSGTYHQVATFFDEVGRLERIVNLDQFQMVEPEIEDDKVLLKTAVVATSFRFLDESERPQQEEENDKKRRRRRGKDSGEAKSK
jgi:type IV pilus assembly protein PilO